jgi:hypothetical protein
MGQEHTIQDFGHEVESINHIRWLGTIILFVAEIGNIFGDF